MTCWFLSKEVKTVTPGTRQMQTGWQTRRKNKQTKQTLQLVNVNIEATNE